MRTKYRTIIEANYSVAIWPNCKATIETNGVRYRIRGDFGGDNGPIQLSRYLTLKDGRALLKAYRANVAFEMRGHPVMSPRNILLDAIKGVHSVDQWGFLASAPHCPYQEIAR